MKAIYQGHYLDDQAVANAARLSFAKLADNFTEAQNHQLIRFLARGMTSGDWESLINQLSGVHGDLNRDQATELAVYLRKIPEHWVPFGHPHISILMEAPVPIARQLFKHKIGFVESEESRRYISSRPVLYIPDEFRSSAANKKQGSGGTHPDSKRWVELYTEHCQGAIDLYEAMIASEVAPEQARFILPQGCEVHWLWTGSLYAFSQMTIKRVDSHAQKESQVLAQEIDDIIRPLYPVSWAALVDGDY